MTQTLYASFGDPSLAEKAAGALLDYGVQKQDLSLVASGGYQPAEIDAYCDTNSQEVRDCRDWNATSTEREMAYQEGGETRFSSAAATAARSDSYDEMENEDSTIHDHGATELAAKSGISTTTPADAGAGAVKGAGLGLGVGVIAGIASLFIPGVGLVLGSGTLAAALGAAAATTAAGAVAGGVTGYLKDQGMSDEAVERYHGTIENGGAILAINLPSGRVDQAIAAQLLSKYGAGDIHTQ